MKLAIYGGSFNPPHLSHVMACAYVLAKTDVDRVLMVPCSRHAFDKNLVPFEDRLAMCRLAVENILDRVEVSDMEGRREGVSYMVDTLEDIKRRHREVELLLVVGSDVVEEIESWKNPTRLRELAELFVIPRLNETTRDEVARSEEFVLPELSSQSVRDQLMRNTIPSSLLPWKVADYISNHKLYGIE